MREFNQIIKKRAPLIKKSILDPHRIEINKKESENKPEQTSLKNNV
jgi:hypothetical protein